MHILEPASGRLACGDSGKGKLPDIEDIIDKAEELLHTDKPLYGQQVLITAGPTQEALDPVRFLTNHSSGKMGYELARAARDMGAHVTLISGPVSLRLPQDITVIQVKSAQEMMEAVKKEGAQQDIIIKAAAVGDYRAAHISEEKIKKSETELTVTFVKNPDILAMLGERKRPGQLLCGFAMETEDLEENARKKMLEKHCDMLVANNLKVEGAGFQNDTNVATFFYQDKMESLNIMSKRELSFRILETLCSLKENNGGK